ncbi:hypothetical protein BX666DRAFT_1862557 [Dichotomocladium elegans]|nr:hypothetical protein BX666DRAFT_1862557 [Dichotomocladium elegans]
MNNQWRAVARYARHQLVHKTNPSDLEQILQFWYLRLLALTKLGLHQLASAELDKLGDLDRPEFTYEFYGANENKGSMVPFELYVLYARLPAWLKHPVVSLERLTMLAVRCKKKQWRKREIQVHLVLATHFLDMGDFASAAEVLEMIRRQFDLDDDLDVLSALGRLHLQLGNISTAENLYTQIEERQPLQNRSACVTETIAINRSFLLIAKGDWVQAAETLQGVLSANKDNLLAMNNLAVCQVYLGQLESAMELLTIMTTENPTSAGTCAAALTNLCTLFELRFDAANEKKVELMRQIARWVGDSFQADCLKLQ